MPEATGALVRRLRAELGRDRVLASRTDREARMTDALGPGRGFRDAGFEAVPPLAVVLPANAGEVAAALRIARDTGTPVVAYGAGTGLMGGARTIRPGLVVDLRRLDRILELDVLDGHVWAQAGTVLDRVNRELAPHGLTLGHDPWTVEVATVGGAIATNGLGFLGGAYGSMGDQTLAVEVALADGSIVRTKPVLPRSTGFDLTRLFVGTEGAFGMVTAAALRAFPLPEARQLLGFRFRRFEDGFDAAVAMAQAGVRPALLDYGDRFAPAEAGQPAVPVEPPTLYLGFEGVRSVVAALAAFAASACRARDGEAMSEEEVLRFWDHRHDVARRFVETRGRWGRLRRRSEGAFDYIHVALPVSRVLRYRAAAMALAQAEGAQVIETGLWVRPGLFSMVLVASPGDDATGRMAAAVDACLRLAIDEGGSVEYCHGAGIRLAHLMAEEHGPALEAMRALKQALDPAHILNPGKMGL